MTADTIVVLRRDIGPASTEEYAAALRERLPDREVRLARTPEEERRLIADAEIATGVEIDEDLLAAAGDLGLFACAFSGTDHLPLEALADRGVAVTTAAGIHAPGLADQVLGKMLTFARRLHEARRRQRAREWRHYRAGELTGSTVTVVGLGSVGSAVVERLEGFDAHTIGVRYTPSKGGPTDEVIGFDAAAVNDALARTEYLVLACPLSETTRGLVDKGAFVTLPPEAVVVNVARGPVVDTDGLVWALREGTIRGAALDVTDPEPLPEDHPLWGFENVLVTPHVGGDTPHNWERLADILARNVARVEETGSYADLENQVV